MKRLKLYLVLAACIAVADINALNAQITLKGRITTDTDEPAVFANVLLRQLRDTTQIVEAVVADMQGNYRFGRHREGRYLLSVLCMGYKPIGDTVNLRRPSMGNTNEITRNYTLRGDAVEIEDVVVVANNVTQHLDRTVYTITNADRRTAVNGLDLTGKIPQVRLDRVNETLSTDAGALTVLVNGIASSEQELKTISPDEVRTMEYYDLPPIRYGGGNKVLNIITKERKEGIFGGIELRNAIPVRWFNDSFYLRYNRGRSQLSFRYYASYHTSRKQAAAEEWLYSLDNMEYMQLKDIAAGYKSFYNDFNLQYTNHLQDKYVFQAVFYPSFRSYSNHTDSRISFFRNAAESSRYGLSESSSKVFNPTLDLYFWKQFGRRQEMIVTFTGNYFDSAFKGYTNEYMLPDKEAVYEDFLNVDGNKYSAIGQALYVKNFDKLTLSFGDRFSYESNKAMTSNSFGSGREVTTLTNNYFAGEVTGKIGQRLSYRLSLGVIGTRTVSVADEAWQWVFAPQVLAGYQINPSFMVKAGFSQFNTSPSIGMLNDRTALINQNIVSRGNPFLKNGYANFTFIGVGYSDKRLNISLSCSYGYDKNPINYYYLEEDGYIALQPINDRWRKNMSLDYAFVVSPFRDNLLSLKLQGSFKYTRIESARMGLFSHFQAPLSYEISFNRKDFSAYYQGSIPTPALAPPSITYSMMTSNIGVRYRYKGFTFSVNCSNFLITPENISNTIEGSAVSISTRGTQKDTYNRIMIGVSYNFGKGRAYKEVERRISNSDEDSGL